MTVHLRTHAQKTEMGIDQRYIEVDGLVMEALGYRLEFVEGVHPYYVVHTPAGEHSEPFWQHLYKNPADVWWKYPRWSTDLNEAWKLLPELCAPGFELRELLHLEAEDVAYNICRAFLAQKGGKASR